MIQPSFRRACPFERGEQSIWQGVRLLLWRMMKKDQTGDGGVIPKDPLISNQCVWQCGQAF
jgi:hypothetical protein